MLWLERPSYCFFSKNQGFLAFFYAGSFTNAAPF